MTQASPQSAEISATPPASVGFWEAFRFWLKLCIGGQRGGHFCRWWGFLMHDFCKMLQPLSSRSASRLLRRFILRALG